MTKIPWIVNTKSMVTSPRICCLRANVHHYLNLALICEIRNHPEYTTCQNLVFNIFWHISKADSYIISSFISRILSSVLKEVMNNWNLTQWTMQIPYKLHCTKSPIIFCPIIFSKSICQILKRFLKSESHKLLARVC